MKIFALLMIHVNLAKVIVILMMNARMVYIVDQKIVNHNHQWIVVSLKVIHYLLHVLFLFNFFVIHPPK